MQHALADSVEEFAATYPNTWEVFVQNATTRTPFIFEHEGSVRWFLTQKDRIEQYLAAGALRKQGRAWLWNPQRFVRTWEQVSQPNPATH